MNPSGNNYGKYTQLHAYIICICLSVHRSGVSLVVNCDIYACIYYGYMYIICVIRLGCIWCIYIYIERDR